MKRILTFIGITLAIIVPTKKEVFIDHMGFEPYVPNKVSALESPYKKASALEYKPVPKPVKKPVQKPVVSQVSGSHEDWLSAAGIPSSDWSCANEIISKESGWNYQVSNASSGAYGLPQALPGSKMASAGADWATNPVTQLKWMKGYVNKYGGFCGAWSFWQSNHWY